MARSTMEEIIRRLRREIGDPAGDEQQFSDDELEGLLDDHATHHLRHRLERVETVVVEGFQRTIWRALEYPWEADVALTTAAGSVVTPAVSEPEQGRWIVYSSALALYAEGRSYDLYAAAAAACEQWAAGLAREYDFSSSDQNWRRSQAYQNLKELAIGFRARSRVVTRGMTRADVEVG